MRELAGAFGQLAQWHKPCAADVTKRAVKLARLANVEDLNSRGMFLEAVGIDLPDAGKGVFERRPARAGRI